MTLVDRRILKSQEAIKKAFIELLSEKNLDHITIQDIADRANVGRRTVYSHYLDKYDLLDKLIDEHISELEKLCKSTAEMSFVDAFLVWFEYFENHYSFFSIMLASKGSPYFRSRFLALVIDEVKREVDVKAGKNKGLSQVVLVQFFGAAIVGIIESYFTNGIPDPPQVVAEQVGILLERNL
ncbi:TetR/AcrR family transcriptional regulator [Paenibacillus chitinolyticus]|uniref:TetR/AcrR family transcriptional regulator n=1 Tax=Paenibacillus chitinolyticus TaxID=79263 RepID=UPI002DBF0177|nr:TetR/AcrR family transcriptional regulator [Paenibacillus chitinolyticus]MEC0249596.1 TetR/AcrR family transcriptional regulator [Paenibacillus chitinolyticus]